MGARELLVEAAGHLSRGEKRSAERALRRAREFEMDAEAENGFGILALELGRFEDAKAAFEAAQARATGDLGLEVDHNLGLALVRLGAFADARRILRRNADAREARYGLDSIEHGMALLTLAEAQLGERAFDLALDTVGEALGAFHRKDPGRQAAALALEAEILAARGRGEPLFADLGEVSPALAEKIAARSIERARGAPAARALVMLEALRGFLVEHLGESHGATIRVLAGIANTHRELEDEGGRRAALDALAASFECVGAVAEVIETLLARALAEVEAGDSDRAVATHAEACARAREARDERALAKALRYSGFLALDLGDAPRAVAVFEEAASHARASSDLDQEARAEAALGLGLAYAGDLDRSRLHFEAALITLPPEDPDVLWIEDHVGGILRGEWKPSVERSELRDAHARVQRSA
jgi:tetratricopeptide (TPR) repeat protein